MVVDSNDPLTEDCAGEEAFSSTMLFFPDCPSLNGVLDVTLAGDLNIVEKLVLICFVDRTDGANTAGFVSDF